MEIFAIKSKLSGLVLEAEGGGYQPNARISPQDFAPGKDSQIWYDDVASGTIRNKASNFCLTVGGDGLVASPYQPGNGNQQWMRQHPFIRNRLDQNQVLDVFDWNKDRGAKVSQYAFNGGENQQWDFEPAQGGAPAYPQGGAYPAYPSSAGFAPQQAAVRRKFFIVSEMHGKVIDVEGGKVEPGAKALMWDKHDPPANNQLWYADGQGIIRSCLNDLGFSNNGKGETITMQPVDGNPRNQYSFQGDRIVNREGECLDIRGEKQKNGAEIISYDSNDQANQKWRQEFVM